MIKDRIVSNSDERTLSRMKLRIENTFKNEIKEMNEKFL